MLSSSSSLSGHAAANWKGYKPVAGQRVSKAAGKAAASCGKNNDDDDDDEGDDAAPRGVLAAAADPFFSFVELSFRLSWSSDGAASRMCRGKRPVASRTEAARGWACRMVFIVAVVL